MYVDNPIRIGIHPRRRENSVKAAKHDEFCAMVLCTIEHRCVLRLARLKVAAHENERSDSGRARPLNAWCVPVIANHGNDLGMQAILFNRVDEGL